MFWQDTLWSFLLLTAGTGLASGQTGASWPQFGGPDCNHVSRSTGLLTEWPKEVPPLLWKVTALGTGYAPVSIGDGRIYTVACRGVSEYVIALDRGTGREIWTTAIGPARESGPMRHLRQRQPVIDQDRVYGFAGAGQLYCLDADAGNVRWKKDYVTDLGGKHAAYGWNENPLIDGERLVCTPGGKVATLVALHKVTGEVIWKAAVPSTDMATCAAVLATEVGGVRQYVRALSTGLVGIAALDGKLLWSYPKLGGYFAQTPIVHGDHIFASGNIGTGCALLKLVPTADGTWVEEIYQTRGLDQTVHGGMVPVGAHVYGAQGAHSSGPGSLRCLELKTGQIVWEERRTRIQALIAADGHLVCRAWNGEVLLVDATPDGYRERGRFLPPDCKRSSPTVLVIAGTRLYLRDESILLCYDLKAT